jgi:Transposase, Mutator family
MLFEECARTTVIPTPTDLKRRGLTGVRLVVSDQHAGLVAALRRAFKGVAHQRCRSSQKLGRDRWVVERSIAWLFGYRRLSIRYERNAGHVDVDADGGF